MKKEMKYFLVALTLLFISCGQKATTYEAKEVLSKHLIERYGEEFEIGYMGRRSDGKEMWYEAEIYPSKYVGTIKERDKYYRESGTANVEKGIFGERLGFAGDTYGIVKINESAEEFYEKKLKELFGDNVLQVYDIKFNRILKDYDFKNIIKVWKEEGVRLTIRGGIYIFGRVENDEDREWYRKQIYEFIQFMKETGTFEYVSLEIFVIDKRVLKETIFYSKDILENLEENRNKLTRKEFFRYRSELLGDYIEDFDIIKNTEKIDKGSYITNGIKGVLYQGIIFYKKLNSPKYIESNNLKNKEKINYDNLNEMQFEWEKF
ncbi:hypothetical protein DXA30_00485 [Fusobacterium ulcerans]|uniref:hypothetical protein n=1 Tax=Fusobacterium ulcerans TaxID=861 RepID=UPI000E4D469C|nr:hypothetical protein [Fusobacterium ulcerans]RGY67079.1 hypothetical protein DXA30_00485 [Fusobacterium ulcerans]